VQEAEVEAEARPVKEVDFHHMEEVEEVEVEVEAEAMMANEVDVLHAQVVEVVEVEVEVKLEIDIVLEQAEVLVLVICWQQIHTAYE
jgi:hypothetical protein